MINVVARHVRFALCLAVLALPLIVLAQAAGGTPQPTGIAGWWQQWSVIILPAGYLALIVLSWLLPKDGALFMLVKGILSGAPRPPLPPPPA